MIVLCRVQLLLDYLGFPPHTPATSALTEESDSSEKLNLNNLAGETLNVRVFNAWAQETIRYLTLGGGNLCEQSLGHLGSLHLMLNLLVDRSAYFENAAVRPQRPVSCDWGQSSLKRDGQEDKKVILKSSLRSEVKSN